MNTWADVGDALKTAGRALPGGLQLLGGVLSATGVGAGIGAPIAAIGGMLAHALGTEATPDAVQAALAASPEAALKALEIETNAKVQLQQIAAAQALSLAQNETQQQALAYADTANARQREVAVAATAEHGTERILERNITSILALIVVIGGGIMLGFAKDTNLQMAIIPVVTLVLGYYFGTTQQSRRKDAMIAEMAKQP
jgi:hypothetical protein